MLLIMILKMCHFLITFWKISFKINIFILKLVDSNMARIDNIVFSMKRSFWPHRWYSMCRSWCCWCWIWWRTRPMDIASKPICRCWCWSSWPWTEEEPLDASQYDDLVHLLWVWWCMCQNNIKEQLSKTSGTNPK